MICTQCKTTPATKPYVGYEKTHPNYLCLCGQCYDDSLDGVAEYIRTESGALKAITSNENVMGATSPSRVKDVSRFYRARSEELARAAAIMENNRRRRREPGGSPTGMSAEDRAGYIFSCLHAGEDISHEDNKWLTLYIKGIVT